MIPSLKAKRRPLHFAGDVESSRDRRLLTQSRTLAGAKASSIVRSLGSEIVHASDFRSWRCRPVVRKTAS